jgi:hypothetical protein
MKILGEGNWKEGKENGNGKGEEGEVVEEVDAENC